MEKVNEYELKPKIYKKKVLRCQEKKGEYSYRLRVPIRLIEQLGLDEENLNVLISMSDDRKKIIIEKEEIK